MVGHYTREKWLSGEEVYNRATVHGDIYRHTPTPRIKSGTKTKKIHADKEYSHHPSVGRPRRLIHVQVELYEKQNQPPDFLSPPPPPLGHSLDMWPSSPHLKHPPAGKQMMDISFKLSSVPYNFTFNYYYHRAFIPRHVGSLSTSLGSLSKRMLIAQLTFYKKPTGSVIKRIKWVLKLRSSPFRDH